jgi:hypothetical protein
LLSTAIVQTDWRGQRSRAVRLLLVLVAITLPSRWLARAHACTIAPSETPSGLLGWVEGGEQPLSRPRNVAFVASDPSSTSLVVIDQASQQPISLIPSATPVLPEGMTLMRPASPLDPSRTYEERYHKSFTVEETDDTTPPEAPAAVEGSLSASSDDSTGCASSTCGSATSVDVDLLRLSRDDRASERAVTYAIYLATTAEGARNGGRPVRLLRAFLPLRAFIDERWQDEDVYVSISAIDTPATRARAASRCRCTRGPEAARFPAAAVVGPRRRSPWARLPRWPRCCGGAGCRGPLSISRLARYNVSASAAAAASAKVTFFEGFPIPSRLLLVAILAVLAALGRWQEHLPFGAVSFAGLTLHPLALLFGLHGSAMVSKTLRIPKP